MSRNGTVELINPPPPFAPPPLMIRIFQYLVLVIVVGPANHYPIGVMNVFKYF